MHSPNCQYLFFQRIPNTTRLSLQQSEEALLCLALLLKNRLDCSFFEFIRDSLNNREGLKFLEIPKTTKGNHNPLTHCTREHYSIGFFCSPTCAMHFNTSVRKFRVFFLPAGILPGRNKIHRQVEIVSLRGWVILKSIMEPKSTTIRNWICTCKHFPFLVDFIHKNFVLGSEIHITLKPSSQS